MDDEDWHAVCKAIYKGVGGAELENLDCCTPQEPDLCLVGSAAESGSVGRRWLFDGGWIFLLSAPSGSVLSRHLFASADVKGLT